MPTKETPPVLPTRYKSTSLADVAQAAGVTKAAASFAFSGKRKISTATRERIFQAARELNYHPNPHAQRLSSGSAQNMVGLFSLYLNNVSWHETAHLHRALVSRGYEAPLYTYGYSLENLQKPETLLRSLCRQLPEAILCNTFLLPDDAARELTDYQQQGGTLICLHEPMPIECDQIIFDREANTHLAAQYVLQAGHRKIGLCTFSATDQRDDRARGFARALQEENLTPRAEWLFEAGANEEGGAWLAERFLKMKNRPTALCIVNDVQASAFVNEVLRAGLRVPEDISVVALDGLPASEYAVVRITTVTQPWQQMADLALSFLWERLGKTYDGEVRKRVFCGEVIERESVKKLA
jgi:LacI family purine nucleotide synthesis repressor